MGSGNIWSQTKGRSNIWAQQPPSWGPDLHASNPDHPEASLRTEEPPECCENLHPVVWCLQGLPFTQRKGQLLRWPRRRTQPAPAQPPSAAQGSPATPVCWLSLPLRPVPRHPSTTSALWDLSPNLQPPHSMSALSATPSPASSSML